MPFAGYTDFADCVSRNRDKGDPDAYCGSIKHKVEDKMKKAYMNEAARAGDTSSPNAPEGTQAEPYAVAFGPTNYDALTRKAYGLTYGHIGTLTKNIKRALTRRTVNKANNIPGNLADHMKRALAAVHGREAFNPKYGDACKQLQALVKLLEDIEQEEMAAQAGSESESLSTASMSGKSY